MKTLQMKILVTLIGIAALLFGCNKADSCRGIDCTSPPSVEISFRIIDSSGNNLIENETLTAEDIDLTDLETNVSNPPYIYENTALFNFPDGEHNYTLTVSDTTFNLAVTINEKPRDEGECCVTFQLNEFVLEGNEIMVGSEHIIDLLVD